MFVIFYFFIYHSYFKILKFKYAIKFTKELKKSEAFLFF